VKICNKKTFFFASETNIYQISYVESKKQTQIWNFLEFSKEFSCKILKFSSKMVKNVSKRAELLLEYALPG
jgi:hypothetical protein